MSTKNHILILAGTSDIGFAIAQQYLEKNYLVTITGRDVVLLDSKVKILESQFGNQVHSHFLDAEDISSYPQFFESLHQPIFGVICCVGYLGNQDKAKTNEAEREKIQGLNFTVCKNLIDASIPFISKNGFIVGISSVAGDRLRESNYYYGKAKQQFSNYLKMLQVHLKPKAISVLDVRPGFVDTKMTAHLDLPKPLTAQPQQVAKVTYEAQQSGMQKVYVLWMWKYIMMIIKTIPEPIFKKLNL